VTTGFARGEEEALTSRLVLPVVLAGADTLARSNREATPAGRPRRGARELDNREREGGIPVQQPARTDGLTVRCAPVPGGRPNADPGDGRASGAARGAALIRVRLNSATAW